MKKDKPLVDWKLCYVRGPWAWFTSKSLADQWGDDWDDAPYEHNAGDPYEPCWHNEPAARNNPESKRGWKPGTKIPLEVGEVCRCESCARVWNDDGTPMWSLLRVAWDGPFDSPGHDAANSRYSVRDINSGAVAWLFTHNVNPPVAIKAGASLGDFVQAVVRAGGEVFFSTNTER